MKKWLVAGILFAAAGLGLMFTPLRFTAALLELVAGVLVVFGLLRNRKKARCVLALVLAAGVIIFAAAEIQVLRYARTRPREDVSAVIVLGAGVYGTRPSLSLLVRLQAALDFVRDKPDIPIIVSGGQGSGEDISEAECMARWLTENGVDEGRIVLEDRSSSTRENLENSAAILADMGIGIDENIAVVSADYHLYRARLYWKGENMVPVSASMDERWWPMTANYYIREAFGVVYLRVFGA